MQLSIAVRLKFNEAVELACIDLGIPYDARRSEPDAEDKRPYIVAAAIRSVVEVALAEAEKTIAIQRQDIEDNHELRTRQEAEILRLKKELDPTPARERGRKYDTKARSGG